MPKTAPNNGVVELSVVDRVGPKKRVPETARLAEREGRKIPTKTKTKMIGLRKLIGLRKSGARNQYMIADDVIEIAVPFLELTSLSPIF